MTIDKKTIEQDYGKGRTVKNYEKEERKVIYMEKVQEEDNLKDKAIRKTESG